MVVACPSGAPANIYSCLGRGNVLSVTLMAVSCLAAVLITPLVLAGLQEQGGKSTGLPVPFVVLAGQLLLVRALPVVGGTGAA